MHLDEQSPTARIADPLRHAPPPGMWALWHGPQADALVDLCKGRGPEGGGVRWAIAR